MKADRYARRMERLRQKAERRNGPRETFTKPPSVQELLALKNLRLKRAADLLREQQSTSPAPYVRLRKKSDLISGLKDVP